MKRVRKIGLAIAGALVVFYLLWVAAATWFIRDGLYRINDWNDEVDFSMGFAVSWWPGHLSGDDLRLVVHDSDVELDLQFDHFALVVDVSQLPNRRFVTSKTRLDGVKFYYRSTRKVPELCKTTGLPPIGHQAMSAPVAHCLEQTETANADTAKSPPNELWQVDLSNLELTNVTDVWIETYRLQGKGIVGESSFFIWPSQRIMVDARTSHWANMQVHIANEQVAEHASADAQVKIDTVGMSDTGAIWMATSGAMAIRGLEGRLDRLGSFEGRYHVSGEATVDHGVPTMIAVQGDVPNLAVRIDDKKLTGSLDVRVRGQPSHSPKFIHIVDSRARLTNIAVDGKRFPHDTLHAQVLRGGALETTHRIFDFEVAATCTTVRPAFALLPAGFDRTIAEILARTGDTLAIAVRFKGPWDHMMADPFTVSGGSLQTTGTLALSPKLEGQAKVVVGRLSKTIHFP